MSLYINVCGQYNADSGTVANAIDATLTLLKIGSKCSFIVYKPRFFIDFCRVIARLNCVCNRPIQDN